MIRARRRLPSTAPDAVIWALLPPPHWLLDEEVSEPESLVYFLLDYDASQVKIGFTEGTAESRLRKWQSHRPTHRLELLGVLRGSYDLERCMHGRFAQYRVEGREWYSAEILPEVMELLA